MKIGILVTGTPWAYLGNKYGGYDEHFPEAAKAVRYQKRISGFEGLRLAWFRNQSTLTR